MLDIHLRALEPLLGADGPPDEGAQHGPAPDHTGPIHGAGVEMRGRGGGQAQDGNHQGGEAGCEGADEGAGGAEVPGPATEAVADKEGADGDWDGEGDEGADGADAEDGAGGDGAGEHEQGDDDADAGVEPDGVDGRPGAAVDALPDARERENVVAGVGVRDARGGHHEALAHAEAADDGEA